jgi:monofunctional biosynthetic peptidoglycan transglycosylase
MSKSTRIVLAVVLAFLLALGAGAGLLLNAFVNPPDFDAMKSSVVQPILLADGKTKSTRRVGPSAPGWVPASQISNHVLMAIIASEDTSFFSHKGVDYHELREAIKKDIEEKKWARGASTLTQQVIKNIFLSSEKSIWRKLKEFLWAQQLEKKLTKSQILTFYVNMAEWAPGLYGIGAASSHYFSIPPSQLSPKKAAFLAMLLPSPRKYHVYFQRRELTLWATRRVNQILHVMNSMGFIDDEEYQTARRESLWGETVLTDGAEAAPGSDDREIPAGDSSALPPGNPPAEPMGDVPVGDEGGGGAPDNPEGAETAPPAREGSAAEPAQPLSESPPEGAPPQEGPAPE